VISILVLTNQKNIFSEIQNAVGNNNVLQHANSIEQLNDILVDGDINIVVIDAAFLKTTNHSEFLETLSFFPELTLIAAVESGETSDLVNLFQNLEIYRYLQKPFKQDQIKKCIDAASRKYTKTNVETEAINIEDADTSKIKFYALSAAIVILLVIASFFIFQTDKETSIETNNITTNNQSKIDNEDRSNPIETELLNIDQHQIILSAKTGASIPDNNAIVQSLKNETEAAKEVDIEEATDDAKTEIINNTSSVEKSKEMISIINDRIETGKLIYPGNDSAIYHLSEFRIIAPEHPSLNELNSTIIDAVILQANNAIKLKEFDQAKSIIQSAKVNNLDKRKFINIEKQLSLSIKKYNEDKQLKEKKERIEHLSKLASKAIEEDKLIYPEKLNAKYYLQSALKYEPNNEKIRSQIESLVSLMLIQIETDINENTFASANSKINKTRELGVKLKELASLEERLNKAIKNR
jgi:hypothetical protein